MLQRFRWFIYDTFDPDNLNCRCAKMYKVFSRIYQTITFWEGPCRKLLCEVCNNYGKLLRTGLYFVDQRTRNGKMVYYRVSTYFCRIKLYKTEYIENGKNINMFMRIVSYIGNQGQDNVSDIKEFTKCIYSSWGFTQKQCIKALHRITELTKDLEWEEGLCDEGRSLEWAKYALDYLKGKKVYFSVDAMSTGNYLKPAEVEEENEKGLREDIYLITRDIRNKNKYIHEVQGLMYTSLLASSKERNKTLFKMLKVLMKKFKDDGYNSFYRLYLK